jgi:hypothetical protein
MEENNFKHLFLEVTEAMFPGSIKKEDCRDMRDIGYVPKIVTELRRQNIRVEYDSKNKYWYVLDGIYRGKTINFQGDWIKREKVNLEDEVEIIEDYYTGKIKLKYRGRETITKEENMWQFKQDYKEDFVDFFKREVDEDIEGRRNSIKKLQVDLETYENLLKGKGENGRFIYLSQRDKEDIKCCIKELKENLKILREEDVMEYGIRESRDSNKS